jgi:hypothetical protein
VRVRGIFPRAADDAVIPLEWAERAQYLDKPSFDPRADQVTVVVDPSRGGAAETVIGLFRKGVCYEAQGAQDRQDPGSSYISRMKQFSPSKPLG